MNVEDDADGGGGEATIEKRTRFSLSHDEGSIGNTSDNLEAISEAASNHSVASSLDDVEQVMKLWKEVRSLILLFDACA